jgi:hypothetical protein
LSTYFGRRASFGKQGAPFTITLELHQGAWGKTVDAGSFTRAVLKVTLVPATSVASLLVLDRPDGGPVEVPLGIILAQVTSKHDDEKGGQINVDGSALADAFNRIFFLHAERNLHDQNLGATGQYELNGDGRNLIQVLHSLSSSTPDTFAEIISAARSFLPGVEGIVAPLERGGPSLSGQTKEAAHADISFEWDEMASGTRHIVAILTLLLSTPPGSLLLIEEPESFLHPQVAVDLFRLFAEVARRDNKQIVLTTHSPLLMEMAGAAALNIVVRDEDTGVSRIVRMNDAMDRVFRRRGLLRTFMFAPYGTGTMPAGLLIVEGPDDHEVWTKWLEREGLAEKNVAVIRGGDDVGDPVGLAVHLRHLSNAGIRTGPFLLVVDSDGDREARKSDLIGKGLEEGDIHVLARKEIEDYLLDADAIAGAFDRDSEEVALAIKQAGRGKEAFNQVIKDVCGFAKPQSQLKAMVAMKVELCDEVAEILGRMKRWVD